jgi:hypothetical protein
VFWCTACREFGLPHLEKPVYQESTHIPPP